MKRTVSCRANLHAERRQRPSAAARRKVLFEKLEERTVFAPFGAFPDDTGEFMLGDVLVTVVLMESDPTMLSSGEVNSENWTAAAINNVQQKVQDGMNWWKQTLATMPGIYYNPALPLLDFKYDWTWALDPVETGYEPISRPSTHHGLWIQDFLERPDVNFLRTGDIYKDVKAFNNFQRERNNTDWAFTIFVVNAGSDYQGTNKPNPYSPAFVPPTGGNDPVYPLDDRPGLFPPAGNGTYEGAFAYLGGQFLVMPSERPTSSMAHETGHIFYALDEYVNPSDPSAGHSYFSKSGYYNTQNTNAGRDNPSAGSFVQQASIMASGTKLSQAWVNNVTSTQSAAMVGWQDTDLDGVMDVLDVNFSLKGTGTFNPSAGTYRFKGTSHVQTLDNQNTWGGQNTHVVYNDITINKIRRAEFKLDDGPWTTIAEYNSPKYQQDLDLTIPGITAGAHTLRIRTFDTKTGARSDEFVATINPSGQPTPPAYVGGPNSSVNGFVFSDTNANGAWDNGEQPLIDWALQLLNIDNQPLILKQTIEPSDYANGTQLNTVVPGITLSAVGFTATTTNVTARNGVFAAGVEEKFATIRSSNGSSLQTDRRLRIEFASPVSSVSLKAIGATTGGRSVGRLIAYDANDNVIDRYTTGALTLGQNETMTISRSLADIKYVVAVGHLETEVLFDSLSVGPTTGTTTNPDGSFTLDSLPAGTYNLKISAAPNYTAISPATGTFSFTVPASGSNQHFAYQYGGNPWRNATDPLNVNGTGGITAFDALMIINYINLHPNLELLVAGEAQSNYWLDVNDDNRVTAFDALAIINYLNTHPSGSGPESSSPEETQTVTNHPDGLIGNGNGNGGGGEGVVAPQTADEYFAANPLHVSQRSKDELHDHSHHEDDHDHDAFFSQHDDHNDEFEFTLTPDSTSPLNSSNDAEDDHDGRILTQSNGRLSRLFGLTDRLTESTRSETELGERPTEEVEEASARLRRLLALRSRTVTTLDALAPRDNDASVTQPAPRREA